MKNCKVLGQVKKSKGVVVVKGSGLVVIQNSLDDAFECLIRGL